MKSFLFAGLFVVPFAIFAAATADKPAGNYPAPPYPDGFLQWKQIKTTTLDPKDPNTTKLTSAHFVYANEQAVEGLRTGKYPEGAVFVLDIFKIEKPNGEPRIGARDSTSSMVRDARGAETGGWVFTDYDVASHRILTATNPVADCYQCHTRKAEHGFVFSTLHP